MQTAVAQTGGAALGELGELQTVGLLATVLDGAAHAAAAFGTATCLAGVRLETATRSVQLLLILAHASVAGSLGAVTADQHHDTSDHQQSQRRRRPSHW